MRVSESSGRRAKRPAGTFQWRERHCVGDDSEASGADAGGSESIAGAQLALLRKIRTGCANERPSGSVWGIPSRLVSCHKVFYDERVCLFSR